MRVSHSSVTARYFSGVNKSSVSILIWILCIISARFCNNNLQHQCSRIYFRKKSWWIQSWNYSYKWLGDLSYLTSKNVHIAQWGCLPHSGLRLLSLTMADQPSSTAAKKSKKKDGGMVKLFRDLVKRPKSANNSTSQSNSTRVSVSSAFVAHDPVPENDTGSAEPTASILSSKCIVSILVLSTTTWPSIQIAMLPWIRVCTILNSYLADLADLAHHPDPTAPFQSAGPPTSVPDLLDPAVGQGELQYA